MHSLQLVKIQALHPRKSGGLFARGFSEKFASYGSESSRRYSNSEGSDKPRNTFQNSGRLRGDRDRFQNYDRSRRNNNNGNVNRNIDRSSRNHSNQRRGASNGHKQERMSRGNTSGLPRRDDSRTNRDNHIDENVDYLYGIQPALLALQCKHRYIAEIIVQDGMIDKEWLDMVQQNAKCMSGDALEGEEHEHKMNFPGPRKLSRNPKNASINLLIEEITKYNPDIVRLASKHDMNLMVDSKPHQGVILIASKCDFKELPVISGKKDEAVLCGLPFEVDATKCVLALDEVWDPQNFGALLRTAQYYGIDKIIACSKNSAPLSPAVSKASAGAMEILTSRQQVWSTNNMEKFLQYSRINNWQVVGASSSAVDDAYAPVPISTNELFKQTVASGCDSSVNKENLHIDTKSRPCGRFDVDKPTILVLGNEGHGLRTNIMRKCDVLLNIPQNSNANAPGNKENQEQLHFDSLNVSVAGGILMHSLVLNRK